MVLLKKLRYFGEDNVELNCIIGDRLVFSFTPIKDLNNDLNYFGKDLDLSGIGPSHELYSTDMKLLEK